SSPRLRPDFAPDGQGPMVDVGTAGSIVAEGASLAGADRGPRSAAGGRYSSRTSAAPSAAPQRPPASRGRRSVSRSRGQSALRKTAGGPAGDGIHLLGRKRHRSRKGDEPHQPLVRRSRPSDL